MLLSVRNLTVEFGGVRAVDGVSLDVGQGEIVGLIGANGAGKTTFIDAVTGFVRVCEGSVRFDGRDLTHLAPHGRAAAGLVRTWQSVDLFEDLTIYDNVLIGAPRARWWGLLADLVRPRRALADERVSAALAAFGLESWAGESVSALSLGQRKLVSFARAFAGAPKLLLLDEPAAGLDTLERRLLAERLRATASAGTTILVVDHDVELMLAVCDRIYALDFGRVIAHGSPEAVRADERVITAYLGAS